MRDSLNLHIHGPMKSAKRAASRYGIPVHHCSTDKRGNVLCHAPCKPGVTNRVVSWYGERSRTKAGRGYPPGTLTFYSGRVRVAWAARRGAVGGAES